MVETASSTRKSLEGNFQAYEQDIRVRNYRMCSLLAMVFMMAGCSLDWIVYEWEGLQDFFSLRLLTAAVLGGIRVILGDPWGRRYYRFLGIAMALPLIFSISWMIYVKQGSSSPYYAGLNLVMLGAAVLMHWPLLDSIIVVCVTLLSYLVACGWSPEPINRSVFFNNIYFLGVTGVFTTAGTWFYNNVRFSEFQLRNALDNHRSKLVSANQKLEENYQKLRELDEVKNRFFANISHELRTPLTLLIAPLERLLHAGATLSQAAQRDLLSTMQGNAMRLLKLINDLLDLAKLQSGRMHVRTQEVDVGAFLIGMSAAVQGVAHDKGIQVVTCTTADLEKIQTDCEKLERICLNLLFNAIKFTNSGGMIEINAARDNDWLVIEVCDTGIGIDPAHLPHVFDRFWQADTSSNRKFHGMGIGLSLVKELVETLGGKVAATSELGVGTTMTVRLPFVHSTAAPTESIEGSEVQEDEEWLRHLHHRAALHPTAVNHVLSEVVAPDPTAVPDKPLLLIADDEPDIRHFLKIQMSEHFTVIEAADGQQAVDLALERVPEIILSDMMMPEKDGLQVCRELRNNPVTRNIPIVLLTADTDSDRRIACLSAGASDFLIKPFSTPEVTVRLQNLVAAARYQRELAAQTVKLESALSQVKETEILLVRNEKLASLGRMSAGLIHEINNPLNYARQGLYMLRSKASFLPEEERPDFSETVKDIEDGVNRVVRIVSDLRGFTRVTNDKSTRFELKPIIETTVRFFAHELKDGIQLTVNVPEGLEIRGDSNHLVQVLINLVQNAIDALRTKTFEPDDGPQIKIMATTDEDHVLVSIRDNGPGIPEEIMNHVFDPFFTTKEVGAGMGLGLAVCHRIITDHGGRIDLRSKEGSYSEFVLEFPNPSAII